MKIKEEMEKQKTETIVHYCSQGKWKDIIDLFKSKKQGDNNYFYDERFLWVQPSEENLNFIKENVQNAGCSHLVSIGCGSGLLEWLIHEATGSPEDSNGTTVSSITTQSPAVSIKLKMGAIDLETCPVLHNCLQVSGIEVDRNWWESPYAPPTFITLLYADEDTFSYSILNNGKSALMFCYFNNEEAFLEYMRQYTGNCLIVIGPGEGRGTHTCPAPFNVKFQHIDQWRLSSFQELQKTRDFIAIYLKAI